MWSLTTAERRAMGFRELPSTLDEALRAMERSELVAETLGEHVFDFFLRNKRHEWSHLPRPGHPVGAGRVPDAVIACARPAPAGRTDDGRAD